MKRPPFPFLLFFLGLFALTVSGCAGYTPKPHTITSEALPVTQPPTETPLGPNVTRLQPTLIPTTDTPTPTFEFTPVDSTALHITYVCNDGFIISVAGKKILIDALFRDSRDICQAESVEIAQTGRPPFDEVDLVLVSHAHWDHFDPQVMGNFLVNNPNAVLIAEKSAAEALERDFLSFALVQEHIHSVELAKGQVVQMSFPGIDLEILNAPADVPNLAFLMRVGQLNFFHSGDSGPDSQLAEYFQAHKWCAKGINFAFLPSWYFIDATNQSQLQERFCAKNYIPMHYAEENVENFLADLSRIYRQMIFFPHEWQAWPP
jgi:L-ascorbate metabolism protein UlaG (beta-lactamase superfamily)